MSPLRPALLAALLAGVCLAWSALTQAALGRPWAALLSAAGGIGLAATAALALHRIGGAGRV